MHTNLGLPSKHRDNQLKFSKLKLSQNIQIKIDQGQLFFFQYQTRASQKAN